jgi:hypothetical protein
MLVSQRIWRVGQSPERLPEGRLASERELEEMIVAKPEMVSDQWMIIGQPAWEMPLLRPHIALGTVERPSDLKAAE